MASEEEWITSQEGAKLLNINPTNFFYYVKLGEIAVKPGSRERGRLYSRSDVLKVRRGIAAKSAKAKPEVPLIDWLRAEDLPAGLKLISSRYGPDIDLAELAIYQSWRKHNNQLTLAAFSQDRSECFASLQLVPLNEQVILDVLSNRRTENSIKPDEIQPYARSGAYTLLVTSAVVHPSRPGLLYTLLYRYMDFWIEQQYPERYITKIYAQAVSEDGARLVQHVFMAPRPDLAYNAYMLDLALPAAARIIREFKRKLEEKAPLPVDLQWPPTTTAPTITSYSIPKPTAQPQSITMPPQQKTPRIGAQAQGNTTLPEGWLGVHEFARRHCGIAATSVEKAITSGRLQVTRGHWTVGRAPVQKALDREQQRIFIAEYAARPDWHECVEDPECPCHFPAV